MRVSFGVFVEVVMLMVALMCAGFVYETWRELKVLSPHQEADLATNPNDIPLPGPAP